MGEYVRKEQTNCPSGISPTSAYEHDASCRNARRDAGGSLKLNPNTADWLPLTATSDPATAAGQHSTAAGQLQRPSSVPPWSPEPAKTPEHTRGGIFPRHTGSRRKLLSGIANKWSNASSKKSLNVDSPSFTPAQLPGGKKSTFSTNATPFTPRGAASCKFDGPSN